ncbi:MAG: hypothetical protein KIT14_05770 [bacterium]|nr:hypothetical protein [bacterium]
MMMERLDVPSAAAALLADAASLGPVRAILRSCSGFVELFCSADAFEVHGGWLHVRQPTAHLHVQVPALAAAAFHDAGDEAHPGRPSLWLLGRCGAPCLLLILDQTEGEARARQETAFQALRARWGTQVAFHGGDAPAEDRLLH